MTIPTILVVGSKRSFGCVLRTILPPQQFDVIETRTGEEALDFVRNTRPNLILLDISLRGANGLEVCQKIHLSCSTPIIVFSERNSGHDKFLALDLGADDRFLNVFGLKELQALICTHLRSGPFNGEMPVFTNAELTVDFERRHITVRGRQIYLTPKQFDLLRYLIANKGRPVTHQNLFEVGWGLDSREHAENLRVVINQLRKKIEANPASPQYILTEPRVGYRFQSSPEDKGEHACA
jgi:two-component system KDP operon response regulator KdpE